MESPTTRAKKTSFDVQQRPTDTVGANMLPTLTLPVGFQQQHVTADNNL